MNTTTPESEAALLSGLRKELARLTREAQRLLAVRWRLAWLELCLAARDIRRLLIGLACGSVLALIGLAVLSVAVAEALNGCFGWPRLTWLIVISGIELLAASLVVWFAWRRFHREFAGLQESVEELQEDLVWLREWTRTDDPPA